MTTPENPRIARERRTVSRMITMYCRGRHGSSAGSCETCRQLHDYAMARLDRCPYAPDKPTCKACPRHCYRRDMRAEMRQVMRYAGPRMLLHHPVLAVRHLIDERRAPRLRSARRTAD